MKTINFAAPIAALFILLAQNSFSEPPIISKTINDAGQTTTSVRYGSNPKIVKLQNGKDVKIISMGPFAFTNGDPPALVLKYETQIDLSDSKALKSEVDEIWKLFIYNVEKAGFTTAAIRAQRPLKGNLIKTGQGHGFVYLKQKDGSWQLVE